VWPAAGTLERSLRIDFHFNVEDRLQYACRVVRKARAAEKSVLAYAREPARLARFDAALWIFSALDFVPHVYVDSPLATHTPVLLTLDATLEAPARDVLLNLDDDVPPGFSALLGRFERMIEVVSRDEGDRLRARERFKSYRAAGIEPNRFEMGGSAIE
jgi:DNA polymerase-3 subunit chi